MIAAAEPDWCPRCNDGVEGDDWMCGNCACGNNADRALCAMQERAELAEGHLAELRQQGLISHVDASAVATAAVREALLAAADILEREAAPHVAQKPWWVSKRLREIAKGVK